ncbi:MAG: type II toxin-antitoxin system RelE/ParE family toxin [Anaerolineales bacterium]|nr:type II toxin-antitoxin system RelE/ParE family toxin [Anaerolineales bacterium]
MYKIIFLQKAEKLLSRYPKKDQIRLIEAIRGLATEPRPAGSVHLREVLYRIRVGDYRVLYAVFDQQLIVVVVKTTRRNERTYAEIQSLIERAKKFLD